MNTHRAEVSGPQRGMVGENPPQSGRGVSIHRAEVSSPQGGRVVSNIHRAEVYGPQPTGRR